MTKNFKLKFLTISSITAMTIFFGQNVVAHTVLEINQINENTSVSNNIIIGHGCGHNSELRAEVLGTSVVFPDGVESIITEDGKPSSLLLLDYVENWTNRVQKIYNRALFTYQDEKTDSNGNVVGFWAGGESLPTNMTGYVPFRIGAVTILSTSCAKSVKFFIPIVDICEITDTTGFSESTVSLWTPNALGTAYDRSGTQDESASLTIIRTSALPESCGDGVAVEVKPSAAQINRDMPIRFNGSQIWPK